MDQVSHSSFLQALGYAIINSLWQFALLWLIYVLVNTILKLSSHQKYLSGLILEVVGFTWFLVTFGFYYRECAEIASAIGTPWQASYGLTATKFGTAREEWMLYIIKAEQLLPYLSIAYLALLVFLCLKWLQAYKYTQLIKTQGLQKIEARWKVFAQQLAFHLGIKQQVSIFLSEVVKTPLTIGFLKPLILIPVVSVNHLTAEQMEAVILHELAHIKRFDYLYNLLLAVIEATLFFNPFMQLISRHIKRERENCCDDWVLQYEYSPASYAKALLQIATFKSAPVLAMKATDDKHVLLNRIKRMIEKKETSFFNYRQQLMALFLMTIVFSILALLSASNRVKDTAAKTRQQIIVEPLAAKVDNPLFNPVFFLAKDDKQGELANIRNKQQNQRIKVITACEIPLSIASRKAVSKPRLPAPVEPPAPPAPPMVLSFDPNTLTYLNTIGGDKKVEEQIQETIIAKAIKDKEVAEQQIKRLAAVLRQKRAEILDQDQIMRELEGALRQLKVAKIQMALAKVSLPKAVRPELIPEPEIEVISEPLLFKKENVRIVVKDVKQDLQDDDEAGEEDDYDEEENNVSKKVGFKFTYNLPPVTYISPIHSYSFEYTEKPGRKAVTYINSNSWLKEKRKYVPENKDVDNIAPAAPCSSRTFKAVRVKKNCLIIKI